MTSQFITTQNVVYRQDGRQLGFAAYGSSKGTPVIFFHGGPGSRLSIFAEMSTILSQMGIHLIALERPGYGLSSPAEGWSMHSVVDDVLVLTRQLGISRFDVLGFSLGSSYALACAQMLPEQVRRVSIVGGLAPMTVPGVTSGMSEMVQALYEMARSDRHQLHEVMAPLAASSAELLTLMTATASTPDQKILISQAQHFEEDFAQALRHGIDGIAGDFIRAAGEWNISLVDIRAKVDLWVGAQDHNAPPRMSHYLASTLPHHRLFVLPDAGHFCLYTHWHRILEGLTDRAST